MDDTIFDFHKDENGKITMTVKPDRLYGIQGAKGDKGDPFSISHIYASVEAMNADYDNPDVPVDTFVLIEDGTGTGEDNGKLYIKDVDGFDYITNLTGAQGIEGPQGNAGVGVPTGGTSGQALYKLTDEDYVTGWGDAPDMSLYPTKAEIEDNLLPTITEEEDNGKFARVVNGVWDMRHIEFGEIIHAETSTSLNGDAIPKLTETQIQTAYNSFMAGKSVAITSVDGKKYYAIVGADSSDADDIKLVMLYADKYLITYNHLGAVAQFKDILQGEVVAVSREYGVIQNDHGFYREWSQNTDGKIWVECGMIATTEATMSGTTITLPTTFEDTNYHVQVTPAELGNFHICANPVDENSINIRATNVSGGALAVKVYVEVKGWKEV